MKITRSLWAIPAALALLIGSLLTGCGPGETSSSAGTPGTPAAENPQVVFGQQMVQSGMSYSLEGAEEQKTGKILGKEYVKLEDAEVTLLFTLDEANAERFAGKPLFVMLEYYESNAKGYTFGYFNEQGQHSEDYAMQGTSAWGGKAIRIPAFQSGGDAGYDFSVRLGSATQMWIRSICVKEDTTAPGEYPLMLDTAYASSDGRVIQGNVKDYGALGNGVDDDSIAFQTALSEMAETGGALYVPAGTYVLTQELAIPDGVTLLGDFNAPSEESPKAEGTVLALDPVTADMGNEKVFFTMRMGSCMDGLTLWYPKQTLETGEAIKYPYTIGIADPIGTAVQNLYLVNVYGGITHESKDTPHYQQTVKNIYGTPLHTGYYAGSASDSDRQENIQFSPAFWLGSGLPGVPAETVLRSWLLTYATGFSLGDIDFHFVSDLTVRGYKIGLHVRRLYGRVYNFEITGCNTCMYIEDAVMYGGQLTNGVLRADGGENPVALLVGETVAEGFTANNLTIESTGDYAVNYLGSGSMALQDSAITVTGSGAKAGLHSTGGQLAVINTVFSGGAKNAVFEDSVEKSSLVNCSAASGELTWEAPDTVSVIQDPDNITQGIDDDAIAQADAARAFQDKGPAKDQLFAAADYGIAAPDRNVDISAALQAAIDAAAAAGGGVVYVPKGAYRLEQPIVVKSGVELQGSTDYMHYVRIDTTVFLTDYGKAQEDAQPLITLEENAGIRGFNIVYDKVTQETIQPYATTIQGQGADAYIVNVTAVGGWYIADFNSHRCDRHYIEGLNFFTFKTGIAVGGGSENGVVINGHANPGALWDSGYTDYKWDSSWEGPLMTYLHENVVGFYVGETKNQVNFMTFIFGSKNGIRIDDGADVTVIGHGTDFSATGIHLTGNANAVIFDPQLIGTYSSEKYQSTAIVADRNFTGTAAIFNTCAWNIQDTAIRIEGGRVFINGGTVLHGGQAAVYADGGAVTVTGLIVQNRSLADILANPGVESICAFGNLPSKNPKYTVADGVAKSGSDLA